MKHLQKFPKNDGDSILLGTIVALGIKPDTGQFFASFDCNGELRTYLVEKARFAYELMDFFNNFSFPDNATFSNLKNRHDLKLEKQKTSTKVYELNNPDNFVEIDD